VGVGKSHGSCPSFVLSLSFSFCLFCHIFDQMGLKTRTEAGRRTNPGTGMKTVSASAKFREAPVRQEGQGIFGTCENPLRLQKTQRRGTLKEH
jgi:hypothetical protein